MLDDQFFNGSTKIGRVRRASYDNLLSHERDGAIVTNGRFVFCELEIAIPKTYGRQADGKRGTGASPARTSACPGARPD
jgi:hypothetical protein